jgi:hypothetical protein
MERTPDVGSTSRLLLTRNPGERCLVAMVTILLLCTELTALETRQNWQGKFKHQTIRRNHFWRRFGGIAGGDRLPLGTEKRDLGSVTRHVHTVHRTMTYESLPPIEVD